jgi:hypothetical protein
LLRELSTQCGMRVKGRCVTWLSCGRPQRQTGALVGAPSRPGVEPEPRCYHNVVDDYIAYLRKKMDILGEQKLIHTVRGVGYALKGA